MEKTKKIEYEGIILPDGHLSCPPEVKKHLNLSNGSRIKVTLTGEKHSKVVQLQGIWSGMDISEEDIAALRAEMWNTRRER